MYIRFPQHVTQQRTWKKWTVGQWCDSGRHVVGVSLLELCDVSCESIELFQSHGTTTLFAMPSQSHIATFQLPAALCGQQPPLSVVACCITRSTRLVLFYRVVHRF